MPAVSKGHFCCDIATLLVTFGILVLSLLPFDFVSCTEELHTVLRRTAWLFTPGVCEGSFDRLTWAQVAKAGFTPDATLFMALGYLMVCGNRRQRRGQRWVVGDAGLHILILAVVTGTLPMFVVTRNLAIANILINGLVGLLGVRLAWVLQPTAQP
ncbi:MAG: hypothetical protein KAV82_04885 [Phycisphaerae bacterium]|nr:hypothetical protein [Phycisphaerae bacterium]